MAPAASKYAISATLTVDSSSVAPGSSGTCPKLGAGLVSTAVKHVYGILQKKYLMV